MKTLSKLLLTLIVAILCISCEKIENNDNNSNSNSNNEQADFYYVRFEASNKSGAPAMRVSMSLSGCKSIRREGKGSSITEILGPAQKNAVASISASGAGVISVRIYASKNNGPFAFQAEGATNTSCILDF